MSTAFHMHKARVEALVDGVFAIAMTILVLEVKVPSVADKLSAHELWHALAHDGVVILAYFVSFLALGIFWVWHHKLMEKVAQVDLPMLVCCLIFLALVCFFPFVAALFGRYPLNLTSNIAYVVLLGLILSVQTVFYTLALKRQQISQTVTAHQALATHSVNILSLAIYSFSLSPTGLRLGVVPALVCLLGGGLLTWYFVRIQKSLKLLKSPQNQIS